MIDEAIILAGGFGTRLKSVVSDRPKPLASVAGKPFLAYLITYLQQQGISQFIFSLGYQSEKIISFLDDYFPRLNYTTVIEDKPLGTGGGIRLACRQSIRENVLICNGDTFFDVNVSELANFHKNNHADCTIALKPMADFDRYGTVETDRDGRITVFKEKQYCTKGLINGGVYLLRKDSFLSEEVPEVFSFEKDYLEKKVIGDEGIFGLVQEGFFIDIGIPEDYSRAQTERQLLNILQP